MQNAEINGHTMNLPGPEGEGEPKRHKPGVLLSGGTQRTHMLVNSTAIKLNDLSNVVSKGLKYCGG